MEQAIQSVQAALSGAGGKLEYPALLEAVPGEYRQWLPAALRRMKNAGQIKVVIAFDAKTFTLSHTVSLAV